MRTRLETIQTGLTAFGGARWKRSGGMKIVSPDSISLSRAYFTEFDRVTYSQVAWSADDVAAIRRRVERKLKLVTLIKGHVVIAASHLLQSELAQEVLFPHPRLFSEGVIVPALRSDASGFEKLLDIKQSGGRNGDRYAGQACREMARMLDSQVALAVRWEAGRASSWFKERLLSDIADKQSLLRSCLRKQSVIVPSGLISKIRDIPLLSRQDVYVSARETGDKALWHILSDYADFVYYLSGARAVRSEGILPQENLMDYSLSDLAAGRTKLAELEVFFKIFVDIVKTATHTHIPADTLDSLSIDDVLDLHSIAVEERFVEKYGRIQERTKDGLAIRDPERLVLLMEELEEFEQQLYSEYRAAIEKELPRYLKDRKNFKAAKFLNATACLVIPVWSGAADIRDIVVSGLEVAGMVRLANLTKQRVARLVRALARLLDRSKLESKPVLLEFVRRMQKRYTEKMGV